MKSPLGIWKSPLARIGNVANLFGSVAALATGLLLFIGGSWLFGFGSKIDVGMAGSLALLLIALAAVGATCACGLIADEQTRAMRYRLTMSRIKTLEAAGVSKEIVDQLGVILENAKKNAINTTLGNEDGNNWIKACAAEVGDPRFNEFLSVILKYTEISDDSQAAATRSARVARAKRKPRPRTRPSRRQTA